MAEDTPGIKDIVADVGATSKDSITPSLTPSPKASATGVPLATSFAVVAPASATPSPATSAPTPKAYPVIPLVAIRPPNLVKTVSKAPPTNP